MNIYLIRTAKQLPIYHNKKKQNQLHQIDMELNNFLIHEKW